MPAPITGPQSNRSLILVGHPHRESLNSALAEAYATEFRESGGAAEVLYLSDLQFDALADPRQRSGPLEPDLVRTQAKIEQAAHLVFVFPTWWGSFPALLKGFLDRCFLSGFAYRFEEGKSLPVQLLRGRTGRILVTMDSPYFFYRWFQGAPGVSAIRKATLKFCGVKMLGTSVFDQIRTKSPAKLAQAIERAASEGRKDGLRIARAAKLPG